MPRVIIRLEFVPITPQKVLLVSSAKTMPYLFAMSKFIKSIRRVIVRSREKCKQKIY